MALVLENTPGRWRNSKWKNGTPGTFAVVIGVSAYTHLTDGATPAPQTYGLGQLDVAAFTAFRFFEWLRDKYRYAGAPIARLWLLLSPTAKEVPFVDPTANAFQAATFDACRDAIGEWYAEMEALEAEACQNSRPLFFFSGHGFEVFNNRHVLLPADYLAPPGRIINRAISVSNLTNGLSALPMREHVYFLDACRTDHQELREKDLKGEDVLNAVASYRQPAGLVANVVCASGVGSPAWAPKDPNEGISLFGQAVLAGLQGQKGFKPECTKTRCVVDAFPLADFANREVDKLLKARGAKFGQPVRLRGEVGNCTIAHLRPKAGIKSAARGDDLGPMRGAPRQRAPRPAAAAPRDDLLSVSLPRPGWTPPTAASFDELHDVLGSEYVSGMWQNARAFNLHTRKWVSNDEAVRILDVHRDEDATAHRVTVEMRTRDAHWFELRDENTTIACTLPGDIALKPRYVIEFTRIRQKGLTHFEARLSPESPAVLGLAARLWEKYRALDMVGATNESDIKQLEQALLGKMQSPLAATIAGIMLLRAKRYDLLRDWLRNLGEKFPERPDGPVLWAEHMLRTDVERTVKGNVFETVLELTTRGLPHTAEAFGYAMRQVSELLQFEKPAQPVRERLEVLHERLTSATRVFRDTGLCSVFIGSAQLVTPQVVLPL